MRQLRFLQAMAETYRQEMARDSDIIMLGEDIRSGIRGESQGLIDQFGPDRVIDTPISEAGFAGFAIGAAMAGMRPIVQFQVASLIYVAFDQLVNQAAKLRLMLGGQVDLPITYTIMASGARGGQAGQHADNPYPYLLHAGFKVVAPSCAHDAKGLLAAAIREDDPVVFIASAGLLGRKAAVPEAPYAVPLGVGRTLREGRDVTVIANGNTVPDALAVADAMAAEGIDVRVWEPRTLAPLDTRGLCAAAAATGRVVLFDDSNRTCGFAAELSAVLAEQVFESLRAPIRRVTRADVTVPFSLPLEGAVLPGRAALSAAIRSICETSARGEPPCRT